MIPVQVILQNKKCGRRLSTQPCFTTVSTGVALQRPRISFFAAYRNTDIAVSSLQTRATSVYTFYQPRTTKLSTGQGVDFFLSTGHTVAGSWLYGSRNTVISRRRHCEQSDRSQQRSCWRSNGRKTYDSGDVSVHKEHTVRSNKAPLPAQEMFDSFFVFSRSTQQRKQLVSVP